MPAATDAEWDEAIGESVAAFSVRTQQLAMQRLREVYAMREEIVTAFIAKHGFEPDRARMIEQRQPDGTSHWFIVRATDEQMADASRFAAQL